MKFFNRNKKVLKYGYKVRVRENVSEIANLIFSHL